MKHYALLLAAAAFVAFAPAIVSAEETHATHEDHAAVKHLELEDGTKVSVEGDAVFVVAADGTKTSAPDGEHKAKDGTVITTKDGKIVHE